MHPRSRQLFLATSATLSKEQKREDSIRVDTSDKDYVESQE